jgi:transposase-like protein
MENGWPSRQPTPPACAQVGRLPEDAEADVLAFYAFPAERWSKLHGTNPLERVNRKIGRRYLSETSMTLVLANATAQSNATHAKEAPELTAS